ncbi:uncharacterized protein LOC144127831 isoform X3 [Amblyomma americanum]
MDRRRAPDDGLATDSAVPMPSNVEVKARIVGARSSLVARVRPMAQSHSFLHQQDTYFGAARGRLKMRQQTLLREDGNARLLSRSVGVRGVVRKRRHLFLVGQTRVHVDTVERLGDFVELEVILKETQTTEEGQAIAQHLCEQLGIATDCLISGSYIDMLPQETVWE